MGEPAPSSSTRKKPFVIHLQAREMAMRVVQMCVEEKKAGNTHVPIKKALERASHYTGLSKAMLSIIKREAREGRLRSPSRKGKTYDRKNLLKVDDIDRSLIHRIIEEFYLTEKVVPTCPKLLAAIREKIDFPWKITSLRKLLKMMGYQWQESHNKRLILSERPAVIFARTNYLRNIRQFRQSYRNIVFLDETWLDDKLASKKCWRDEFIDSILTSSTEKLILIHAGSRGGFLDGTKLIFEAGSTTGAYQGQMNSLNFEKWITEMLIPNLPPNSVVVMDNAAYHSQQENKTSVPTKSSAKTAMLNWLTQNNIKASMAIRKDALFNLIELHKPEDNVCKIDQLIKTHGHDVLRLPPYMCDLNPMELAWAKIKEIVWKHKFNSNLSLEELKQVTEWAISQVAEEDWCGFDDQVITLENNYWKRDEKMENTVDRFMMEVSEGEDSDSVISGLSESDSE